MSQLSTRLLQAGLTAIHWSGAGRALGSIARGRGVVFMLHHVRPAVVRGFAPNALLEITPEFLETVIVETRRAGFDIVSLDEAHKRITGSSDAGRPFACFTFDDGYRDNRDHALPVLERHGVPFTVFVTSDFADGQGFLWWISLEEIIAARRFLAVTIGTESLAFPCTSDRERYAAFEAIYWRLRKLSEREARAIVARLAAEADIDPLGPCRRLVMSWDELRALADDPLVTIGAHTVSHLALAGLDTHDAYAEMLTSITRIEQELGRPCRHFCYPYGDAASAGEREFQLAERLGMATAVTTRKGFVHTRDAERTTALPRLSLNGNFQRKRYLRALLSGVPFALLNASPRRRRPGGIQPSAGGSGLCIHHTSQPAGTTQASPPTR